MGILSRAVFVLVVVANATVGVAQSRPASVLPIPPGARVRVAATSLVGPLVANYLETRGDTLVLVEDRAGRGLWTIPYDQVRRVELSIGQKKNHLPHIARGGVIGGAVGFLAGVIFAATFEPSDTSKKFRRLTTGSIFGGIGMVAGGIVGSRISTENWSPIALPRRLSLIPSRTGAAMRLDLSF